MKIKSAEFVTSNSSVANTPKTQLSEYAFIGRSNVGKSSLINMLVNIKHLAKVSNKPGKTRLINHFKINNNWFLVDLPGYGYAQVSKKKREVFKNFIYSYLKEREQMVCVFLLIDSRHKPQKLDLELMTFLGKNKIPFCIVFTKADKLGTSKLNQNIDFYKKELLHTWESLPPCIVTSSSTGYGRNELLSYIDKLNFGN